MHTMTRTNGETMAIKWPYPVAGVAIGGLTALTLQLLELVSASQIRLLGPALVFVGGILGTAVMKWRQRSDEGSRRS